MKFLSPILALTIALPALAQTTTTQTLSYDPTYDNPSLSLSSLACSDGTNGLETKGYTTLGSLPTFPNLGGAYTVTGWNSPACGTCYALTYPAGGSSGSGKTIYALAVDVALDGFNLSQEAMDTLTGGLAVELGRVDVSSVQVNASFCGL